MVKDSAPGWYSPNPTRLTNVNGTLFFMATDDTHGSELWKSDGTAAGTTLVKDIDSGGFFNYGNFYPNSSYPRELTNVNGTLFFAATDGPSTNLWKSASTWTCSGSAALRCSPGAAVSERS